MEHNIVDGLGVNAAGRLEDRVSDGAAYLLFDAVDGTFLAPDGQQSCDILMVSLFVGVGGVVDVRDFVSVLSCLCFFFAVAAAFGVLITSCHLIVRLNLSASSLLLVSLLVSPFMPSIVNSLCWRSNARATCSMKICASA